MNIILNVFLVRIIVLFKNFHLTYFMIFSYMRNVINALTIVLSYVKPIICALFCDFQL